ncbi:NUDIX hydrolase [Antarcticibacterium flavum]|uniref:NUDIX hydrolase n=1 Tax=Antarcticibacterium flavum TaxID=2058175 RepID=A0A5B7WZV3_9FLAO|nr:MULTISPECIES: NUDIX hydrolase [Antarcticibacterium]MCM4161835.1 NUDIX hydrolase [Antarcticibacterium sp. W02-3]QCY67952.1 NUDIX hydrolase [Antarcticibacterium flavum]
MGKQDIGITVDAVVFVREEKDLRVLLIKRKNDPFKNQWALPGGFLEENESLVAGAKRELDEETGLKPKELYQIKAFGDPGRDPRGRIISIAFLGVLERVEEVKGGDDAGEARWFPVSNLPELAFDHSEIIASGREMF